MCGLPSIRATSGRAANASATSSCSFHQDCVNDVEGAVLKPTFAQPLQNRPLCSLSFVQQSVINETALLGFGLQDGGRA